MNQPLLLLRNIAASSGPDDCNEALYGPGYPNQLEVTLKSGGLVATLTSGKPALKLSFPKERLKVVPRDSKEFTLAEAGPGLVTVAPKTDFVFDSSHSIVFVLEVTFEKTIDGPELSLGSLGLPGWRGSLTRVLTMHRPPQAEDEDLKLQVAVTGRKAVYFSKDLDAGDAKEDEKEPAQEIELLITSGTNKKIEALEDSSFHLSIYADYGDEMTDLVPEPVAHLLGIAFVKGYENSLAKAEKRQDKSNSFNFYASSGIFLGEGGSNKIELKLTGILPGPGRPSREGIANLYFEYKGLKGYKSGVVTAPVWKRLRPTVKLKVLSPNPAKPDDKGLADVTLGWEAKNFEARPGAIVIRMASSKRGFPVHASAGLLRSRAAEPAAPIYTDTFSSNQPEGTVAGIKIDSSQSFKVTATDAFGGSASDTIEVGVEQPEIKITDFKFTPNPVPLAGKVQNVSVAWAIDNRRFVKSIELVRPYGPPLQGMETANGTTLTVGKYDLGKYTLNVFDVRNPGGWPVASAVELDDYEKLLGDERYSYFIHNSVGQSTKFGAVRLSCIETFRFSPPNKCQFGFNLYISLHDSQNPQSNLQRRESYACTWALNGSDVVITTPSGPIRLALDGRTPVLKDGPAISGWTTQPMRDFWHLSKTGRMKTGEGRPIELTRKEVRLNRGEDKPTP
jgi:hypothetical protein